MMLLLPSVSSVAHLWRVPGGLTCAVKVIGESQEAQIELRFLLQHGVRKARPPKKETWSNLVPTCARSLPTLFTPTIRSLLNMFRSLIVRGLPGHASTGSRRPVYRRVTRNQNLMGRVVVVALILRRKVAARRGTRVSFLINDLAWLTHRKVLLKSFHQLRLWLTLSKVG